MDFVYVLLTALLIAAAAAMILKKMDSKLVFLFLGVIGLFVATIINGTSVLGDSTTGSVWLDVLDVVRGKFVSTIGGTGIRLMMIGGYVMLMNHVKAADVLATVAGKGLTKLKNPYVVLALVYIVGAVLKIFITSQIALGLLFMATMYPILTRLGVSRVSCAAVMVSIGALDLGPNDSTTIFGASDIMNTTPMEFFVNYEGIIGPVVILSIAVFYAVYFSYMDRKEFGGLTPMETSQVEAADSQVPGFYGLFPLIPLTLVVVFSFVDGVKMDVITAHIICYFLFFIVDLIVRKDMSMIVENLNHVWVWMGGYFHKIIVLISAAGVFAEAIKQLKGIDVLANLCASLNGAALIAAVGLSLIVFGTAILTGSGNAPWFAFGPLAPNIANTLGANTALLVVPMHLAGGLGRCFSPLCGGMIAVSGMAELDTNVVCKRNILPMTFGYIVTIIASYVVFGMM